MRTGIAGAGTLPSFRRVASPFMFCLAILPCTATAQQPAPVPLRPEAFHWFSPPGMPDIRAAWVIGAEAGSSAYLLRVKLAPGGRIPPHTHPDERSSTVLSGTLYVGFGDTVDEARMVAIPAGGVYVAPARVPHYLWAKDGEVTYQEAGTGPTGTVPVVGAGKGRPSAR